MLTRRMVGRSLAILAGLFLVAQVFPIDRGNPAVDAEVPASPGARTLLRRACYDCHSNETIWPWYSRVAPVSWLVAHDVHEGREAVNFSTWDAYGAAQRAKKLRETTQEVAEGEMPPWYYLLLHPEARLTADDVAALRTWAAEQASR